MQRFFRKPSHFWMFSQDQRCIQCHQGRTKPMISDRAEGSVSLRTPTASWCFLGMNILTSSRHGSVLFLYIYIHRYIICILHYIIYIYVLYLVYLVLYLHHFDSKLDLHHLHLYLVDRLIISVMFLWGDERRRGGCRFRWGWTAGNEGMYGISRKVLLEPARDGRWPCGVWTVTGWNGGLRGAPLPGLVPLLRHAMGLFVRQSLFKS